MKNEKEFVKFIKDLYVSVNQENKQELKKHMIYQVFLKILSDKFPGNEHEKQFQRNIMTHYECLLNLNEFLNQFKYTIDEDSEDDSLINPEILQSLFENLLENKKSTGTYYTPKEIVLYMCDGALETYLSDFNVNFKMLVNEISDDEKKMIIEKLSTVTICDPAVGCGAFPVAMLNKICNLRELLGDSSSEYEIKLHTIENCLFGMDIEPMAIDITRKRLYLSLISDGYTIPFHNIKFNFEIGDSLIELKEKRNIVEPLEL